MLARMLRRLTVRNLAIVEDLEMDLSEGLTVITGETGAGKSILVDALALLAGGRGSSQLVRTGAPKLSVAGEFDADGAVRKVLAGAGLTPEGDSVLLRRDLSPEGRGRAFVEDEPASVRTLSRIGERLLSIHGQYSEQELEDPAAHLELLDSFARADAEGQEVATAAARWGAARDRLESLEASGRQRADRLETLAYQIGEIESVAPTEREEGELSAERERLRHADRIRRAGEAALAALSEDEGSAADRLGEAARAFAELAGIDPREDAHRAEAEELKGRIADLAAAARDAAGATDADPERLSALEGRLEQLSRLKRRYGATVAEILRRLEELKEEHSELSHIGDSLDRTRREEAAARAAYVQAAAALSAKRRAAAPRFSTAVEKELRALAMDKARFRVALEALPEGAPRTSGLETASFLFAPNPGEPEKPIERIASGGELSRAHLAIRTVAAGRRRSGRTLVFDEVDAGIGGRVAEVVGRKLRELSRLDQVLCVTHVPQIAALADSHFLAEKSEIKGRTVASVRRLGGSDRVSEIARMLAGEKVPGTALDHARTLLEGAAR
jgi:DNA repair protein RecN (Recombination protein N)